MSREKQAQNTQDLVVKYWRGTIKATRLALKADGYNPPSERTINRYLNEKSFIDKIKQGLGPENRRGIMGKEELQRFWTAVAEGAIVEGFTIIKRREEICPGEADWRDDVDGPQFREIEEKVPHYPAMKDRLKATELLGKSLALFVDRVDLTGDLKINASDLLDADLKPAIEAEVIESERVS